MSKQVPGQQQPEQTKKPGEMPFCVAKDEGVQCIRRSSVVYELSIIDDRQAKVSVTIFFCEKHDLKLQNSTFAISRMTAEVLRKLEAEANSGLVLPPGVKG